MDWDEAYRRGETQWDRGRSTPALTLALKELKNLGRCRILVPGCGYGHDAYALAQAGHEVIGWDLSPTAIQGAQRINAHPNSTFHQKDFFTTPLEGDFFDVIFEHTFLCAMSPENWPTIARRYALLLKPEGCLLAVLFTHMQNEDPPPYPTSVQQVKEIFSPYFRTGEGQSLSETFSGREGEETFWSMRCALRSIDR